METVLSIAGFDPSGGAGTLADIKTMAALGCFGTAAITSLTFQNTMTVDGAVHQSAETVRSQIEPIVADFKIAAVKTGMLPTREIIEATAECIKQYALPNVVIDPVIRSTSGFDLIDDAAMQALIERLFPLADVVTPNMAEAERLTAESVTDLDSMQRAAERIWKGCKPGTVVLVKGGHLENEASDVLFDGTGHHILRSPKLPTRNTHGTGCTLSSAIAAFLANGLDVRESIERAKRYVTEAIRSAPGLGHGAGPLNHFPLKHLYEHSG